MELVPAAVPFEVTVQSPTQKSKCEYSGAVQGAAEAHVAGGVRVERAGTQRDVHQLSRDTVQEHGAAVAGGVVAEGALLDGDGHVDAGALTVVQVCEVAVSVIEVLRDGPVGAGLPGQLHALDQGGGAARLGNRHLLLSGRPG